MADLLMRTSIKNGSTRSQRLILNSKEKSSRTLVNPFRTASEITEVFICLTKILPMNYSACTAARSNEGTVSSETRGKTFISVEGAEVYFRNLELRPLKKNNSKLGDACP
jgi:hypothetical protein